MIPYTDRLILKRLWTQWIRSYKSRLGLIVMLMVLVALTSGAYPALISHVFDILAAGTSPDSQQDTGPPGWFTVPRDPFITVPLLIIALAALKGCALFFQVLNVNNLGLRISTDIQKAMAAHLVDADLAVVTSEPPGAFISRIMNDLNLVREAIIRMANNLIRDVLTIIVMVGVMLWFNWLLCLLVLAVYPLAMHPIIKIGNRQRKASNALQEHLEMVTSLLGETLQGIRMIKAYQRESAEKTRTKNAFDRLYHKLQILLAGRARIDPILEVLGGIAVAGVVGVAAWQVSEGRMQVGDVAGFITALLLIVQPVRALGTLHAVTQEGLAAASRIFSLLDTKNKIIAPPSAPALILTRGHIRFDNVSFAYQDKPILQDISFEIKPGQTIALVGPSGSGKSSLINLLPRLYDVTKGTITIDHTDITQVTLASLRAHMGLVSQEAVLFDDTIAANIRFGQPSASDADVQRAALAAAADEFIANRPDGYAGQVGTRGEKLSGGQRQRIAIARAVLKNAPILLLDEATSALDAQSEQQVQIALDQLSAGRTTLVAAHRLSTVQKADVILVLEEGRIVQRGPHQQLIDQDGLYAKLCALQSLRG